ncbi:MAG: CocE/NonD family hydrolase [Dongiaceae bacterium]
MSAVEELRPVREIETLWVPLADGTRLAARVWLPEDAESRPVPVVLEYIPYRRRDGTRDGDDLMHPYVAARGYACVRIDIRGSGDSDGLIRDEYLRQEQDDAVEAIAWLSSRPWCTGAVGMIGISWGGFNSLQVAARRPPALKAIISVCSTDDRYADDMHYMGGCVVTDTLAWGSSFFARMARAPDPRIVGEAGWRERWRERLAAASPIFATWLRHQRRDAYWQHGSICEDPASVEAAAMLVGGWADGYSNAIFRMLRDLPGPRQAIVGPWGHKYPFNGVPGPAIGFLQEALRWWDFWLKSVDTGIMREPMLRAYLQDAVPPKPHYDERPGEWVGLAAWPGAATPALSLRLGAGTLAERPGDSAPRALCSPQSTGLGGGEWCPYGMGGLGPEMPLDQREDDGKSLVFDGAPLAAPLSLLGAPRVELALSSDRPEALVAVRLEDVAPDGASTRVTYGVLNLTHRESHATPAALDPGRPVTVTVQLNEVGYVFPAGHRLRLAVSNAYWPIVWPSPRTSILTIEPAGCRLELPLLPADADRHLGFGPAVTAPPTRRTFLRTGGVQRRIERDLASAETVLTVTRDDGRSMIEAIGVETEFRKVMRYRILEDDPASARMEIEQLYVNDFGGRRAELTASTALACTADSFVVTATLKARDGTVEIFARDWTATIPRDLV